MIPRTSEFLAALSAAGLFGCGSPGENLNYITYSSVQISTPVDSQQVLCVPTSDGGRIEVAGTAKGFDPNRMALLLYLHPHHPAVNGWVLQFGETNGIKEWRNDGSFRGAAQLGSSAYPPAGGEVVSIGVVAVSLEEEQRLLELARKNPGVPEPRLPVSELEHHDIAENLRVKLNE